MCDQNDTLGEPIYAYTRAQAVADGVLAFLTLRVRNPGSPEISFDSVQRSPLVSAPCYGR
jgi:hypothetical protein